MPDWTPSQSAAIEASGCNVLVSAAAGSGKTTVLVERVIRRITDPTNPINIDKYLIVTFTNAAASDMKAKIAKKLNEIVAKNPNDTNALRQLSLLPNAKISTIDSFCINLVRENFFKLDIDQDFKILDDSERRIIEQNSIEEILEEYYVENSLEFNNLLNTFSTGEGDYKLVEAIKGISDYVTAQDFPNDWLDEACTFYDPSVSFEKSMVAEYYFSQIIEQATNSLNMIKNCKKVLTVDDVMYDKLFDMLSQDEDVFNNIIEFAEEKKWDELKDFALNVKFATKPRKSKEPSFAEPFIAKSRNIYKDKNSKAIKEYLSFSSYEYEEDCNELYPVVKLLTKIVKEFNSKSMEYKKEANAYTFSDLEHFAIDLLFFKNDKGEIERTQLAKELQNEFVEILVDEYQDTNSAQDKLFEMLSNGKNRFMVGDVKQSIYRFRLAMPFIFTDKKNSYLPYSKDSNYHSQKIILSNNFRSRKGVCDYTNFIFSNVMSTAVGDLEYNDEEKLNFSAKYEDTDVPSAQLCIVETPEDEDVDEYEAHQVAKYILKKIESKEKIKDGDNYRNIGFGDFAILLRSAKARMPIFNQVFAQYGIPTVSENRTNLFSNSEIIILLNLIRIVDNPTLDIPMLATLMSLFYGYSADQIASAKIGNSHSSLYSAICKTAGFEKVVDDISRYRTYAASMSVENFIRTVLSETSYLSIISSMGNQEQRKLNIMKLVDIAKKFDSGENVGLTSFVRYVDSIISNGYDIGSATVNHNGENAVSIMTVHHSKGLEFPVVVYAGTSHKYNTQDLKQIYQLNPHNGIGIKAYNKEKLYRYNSVQYSVISDLNKYASMSENLRVLYVAITRAKEQFVSFYSTKSIEKSVSSVAKRIIDSKIVKSEVKSIASDGDMILTCALLHKDANCLRGYLSDEISSNFDYDFNLKIEFCNEEKIEINADSETECTYNEEKLRQITEKLSFNNERLEVCNYLSKRTASSLDNSEQNFDYLTSSVPAFLNKNHMTPAQKGTAMHAFMEHCDYNNSKTNLSAEIDRLVKNSHLTIEQAESLDKSKIHKLFDSEFANRLFNSDKLYREIKVSSYLPVNELEDTEFEDLVLVQGIADCVFEENGELVLVDYKTDKVNDESELLERYKNQLSFYKYAISKTLNKPVKETILYSFSLNKPCIYK